MAVEITEEFVWQNIPRRPRDSHKGTFGSVLAVAGSAFYRGAALLAAEGALRTGAGIVKARVVYGEKGIEDVSYSPYTVRHVHSLALIQADHIDYTYKSAGREPLNRLFALRGACDDILIVKQGLLTDTSIANIALSDGTHWYTPAHPLLKGTKRAALLEEGILQEKDIRPEDLPSFSTVRLFNAMIDWGELELPVRNIIP